MRIKRYSFVIFWLLIIALSALYFTNDFGLVDIHKTAIIAAVGVDVEGEEVQVTAQLAVPKPSQSGENVEYTEVQGSGETIADALNEINAKTGFYPKLQFCKLILLGDSCQKRNIFQVLGCFYRKNYSELTALVAMCKGKASEMLSMPVPTSDMNSTAIQRVLAEELKKSANVSSVSLKDIAVDNFSKSAAVYMPYVEANKQGTSAAGGDGDNVGGEPPQGSQGGSQGESGSQGGGSGESGGGSGGGESGGSGGSGSSGGGGSGGSGGSGESGGGSGGGSSDNAGQSPVEFTARKTAIFSGGEFRGILDERQSFALDLIKNDIRLAVLPCDAGGLHYTLGLKGLGGGSKIKIEDGKPRLTLKFSANAQIAGVKKVVDPDETASDDVLSPEVIEGAKREIEGRFQSLIEVCREKNCDLLGVKNMIFKFDNKNFDEFADSVLGEMKVQYKIDIKSAN